MNDVELKVTIPLPKDAAMGEEMILCLPVEGNPEQAIVDTVPVLAHGVTFRDRIAVTKTPDGKTVMKGLIQKSGYVSVTLLPDLEAFKGCQFDQVSSRLGARVHETLNQALGLADSEQNDDHYAVSGSFVGMVTVAISTETLMKIGPKELLPLLRSIEGVEDHSFMDMGSHKVNQEQEHADYPLLMN